MCDVILLHFGDLFGDNHAAFPSRNPVYLSRGFALRCRYSVADPAMGSHCVGGSTAMMTLQNAIVGYDHTPLFPPLCGHFIAGSLTAVIGVNGAGKSTLLKSLAGLHPLLGGKLNFAGGKAPAMAYLPQLAELDRQFPILVQDLVAMGCWPQSGLFGGMNKCSRQHIAGALDTVGMSSMAREAVGELSGGQLQRVLFARLLVQQAPLILLDEPFTGIDTATTQLLLRVIAQLHREGRTVIAVLHDMSTVANHFPEALLLTPERCHWDNTELVLAHYSTAANQRGTA
ncbi:Iron(3+)-hydroxamate import ATP-binding protein FhuC [Serratia fonticola]|nr:Iron(3+)-hydroxamate import ATP-binding protein FhuC [Serratia fonticola]